MFFLLFFYCFASWLARPFSINLLRVVSHVQNAFSLPNLYKSSIDRRSLFSIYNTALLCFFEGLNFERLINKRKKCKNIMFVRENCIKCAVTLWISPIAEYFRDITLSRDHFSFKVFWTKFQLIQFKVVHDSHYSKFRLAEICLNIIDGCYQCSQSPCNLIHMFWSCPNLVKFRKSYFGAISNILWYQTESCAHTGTFCIPDTKVKMSVKKKKIKKKISLTSVIAQCQILLLWKRPTPPSSMSWLYNTFC